MNQLPSTITLHHLDLRSGQALRIMAGSGLHLQLDPVLQFSHCPGSWFENLFFKDPPLIICKSATALFCPWLMFMWRQVTRFSHVQTWET